MTDKPIANIPETLPGKGQVSLGLIHVGGTIKEYFGIAESEKSPGGAVT